MLVGLITTLVLSSSIYNYLSGDIRYVKSNIDGRKYLVRNLPDSQKASDQLAMIRNKLNKMVKQLKREYPDDVRVKRLCKRFRPDALTESNGRENYTSYTVNKGQKIVLCLRHRPSAGQRKQNNLTNKNGFVEDNTLFFVCLHELAHVMSVCLKHKPEFWDNFKFLLKFAIDKGYYDYQAFHQQPADYCGIKISDTPYKLET